MPSAAPCSVSTPPCEGQVLPQVHAARRKAVMLGGGTPALEELSEQLEGHGFGLRPFESTHAFFRELHSFSPSLITCATIRA